MRPQATTALLLAAAAAAAAEPPRPIPETEVRFETRKLTGEFFSEGATVADINKDGKPDLVAGPFWYAGPSFEDKHEIYPPEPYDPKAYSHNFLTFDDDFDGDGWTDVLVFGFPGKEAFWFRNPGEGSGHWDKHMAIPVADNESPTYADADNDGKREIVCSVDGRFIVARPAKDPAAPWTITPVSEPNATGGKYTHGLGVGDVNGDSRPDIIDKDNWWEHPAAGIGEELWERHRYQFAGPGGAQMFAYDFDGDGDNDILSSLAAHAWGLAWFEQTERDDGTHTFVRHLIIGEKPEENPYGVAFSQMHAIDLADIDGDGVKDVITGKRYWAHGGGDPGAAMPAVLYWLKTVPGGESGKADFIPYLIHDDSGVGTQVMADDITGDGKIDIVVGNKKGTFVHIQK